VGKYDNNRPVTATGKFKNWRDKYSVTFVKDGASITNNVLNISFIVKKYPYPDGEMARLTSLNFKPIKLFLSKDGREFGVFENAIDLEIFLENPETLKRYGKITTGPTYKTMFARVHLEVIELFLDGLAY
jgi:hypothetical protein